MTTKETKKQVKQEVNFAKDYRKSLKASIKHLIEGVFDSENNVTKKNFTTLCVLFGMNMDSIATCDAVAVASSFSIKGAKRNICEKFPIVGVNEEGKVNTFFTTQKRYFGTCLEDIKTYYVCVPMKDYLGVIKTCVNNCVNNYVDTINGKKCLRTISQVVADANSVYIDKTCAVLANVENMIEYKKTKEGYIAK